MYDTNTFEIVPQLPKIRHYWYPKREVFSKNISLLFKSWPKLGHFKRYIVLRTLQVLFCFWGHKKYKLIVFLGESGNSCCICFIAKETDGIPLDPRLLQEAARMTFKSDDGVQFNIPEQSRRISDFFLLLAICNTVVVSQDHIDKVGR